MEVIKKVIKKVIESGQNGNRKSVNFFVHIAPMGKLSTKFSWKKFWQEMDELYCQLIYMQTGNDQGVVNAVPAEAEACTIQRPTVTSCKQTQQLQ